jgi:lipoyl(octanoyl) transferase
MATGSTARSLPDQFLASLEVYLLGLVDFESALFLQERLVCEIAGRNDAQGALLICEHPPIVTIGREGSGAHIRAEPRELVARQIDVRWLNRGGGCLVHAPGQLAIYPIVPLDRLALGTAEYRNRLEESVVDACREVHVSAFRLPGQPGVWCRLGQFAFVGAAVRSWVSYHGMFVNVAPSLEALRLVRSASSGDRVTTLAAQRSQPVSMHAVRSAMVHSLASGLGYERYHLYTGHPLLRRTKRKIYVHA